MATTVAASETVPSSAPSVPFKMNCNPPDEANFGRYHNMQFARKESNRNLLYTWDLVAGEVKLRLECKAGFTVEAGVGSDVKKRFSHCTYDEGEQKWTWTKPSFTCVAKDCQQLPAPENGVYRYTQGYSLWAKTELTCNDGYQLSEGRGTRVCMDGNWSGSENPPRCVKKPCPDLEDPANGAVNIKSGLAFGDSVKYTCNGGFMLLGGVGTRYCNSKGQWDEKEPTCVNVACADPTKHPNATVVLQSGDEAKFTCKHDASVTGSSKCEYDPRSEKYEWTPRFPDCPKSPPAGVSEEGKVEPRSRNNAVGWTVFLAFVYICWFLISTLACLFLFLL